MSSFDEPGGGPAVPRLDRRSVPPLYVIADAEALAGRDLSESMKALAAAGVGWIQLRAKALTDAELYRECERCMRALEGSESLLWINDRADLARMFGVAGLHLGQDDLPPRAARKVVAEQTLVGCSTHDLPQLEAASSDPSVDVVAIGPVFETRSKANPDRVVGLDLVAAARRASVKPLIAIGGIGADTARDVLRAGADSVAVISAVCSARDLEHAAGELLRRLKSW